MLAIKWYWFDTKMAPITPDMGPFAALGHAASSVMNFCATFEQFLPSVINGGWQEAKSPP